MRTRLFLKAWTLWLGSVLCWPITASAQAWPFAASPQGWSIAPSFQRWSVAAATQGLPIAPSAQAWPSGPVKMVVPTPAGSAPDIVARLLGEQLAKTWGQPIVVDNRAGAGGIPAMSAFKRAEPNGLTLGLFHTAVVALTPHLFKNPMFNVETDIVTVSTVVNSPLAIAVNPKLGVTSLDELFKLAKARQGKLVFAAPLLNSVPHLVWEELSRGAGAEFLVVPHNGSASSITATLAGDGGDVTVDAPAPLMPHFKTGRLQALAITSGKRLPGLESYRTVSETIPGYEAAGWFALFAPARTPPELLERINRDVQRILQQPEVVARLADLGLYPALATPAASAEFVKQDRARWHEVIRQLGIQPQ